MAKISTDIDITELYEPFRIIIREEMHEVLKLYLQANTSAENAKEKPLDMKEVCAYLHLSRSTVNELISSGRLESKKPKHKHLFEMDAIKKYLNSLK